MRVDGDFFDKMEQDTTRFIKGVRDCIVDLVVQDTAFKEFLENAVEAAVYRPGMTLEEVAFREGYRTLAQQLLSIGRGE